ncbi:MAG: sulfide/dihydroorotate dehydrogenase-like FAD/NAD-binding protein [Promethearchaeota archaeon]|jgi:NADH dehydrogenase/NADH:ubiquinone oxidoreductase subunit G/NAD(P)H-flavin reductase
MSDKQNTLQIDGRSVSISEGQTILEVARNNNIYIPTLCYIENLTPYGSCRLCIIKVDGMRGYPTACSTVAQNDMKIITNDDELRELRIEVLKLLLSEHPNSCIVCENKYKCNEDGRSESKAGRSFGCYFCSSNELCDLREIADYLEIDDIGYQLEYKNSSLKRKDPFIEIDPNLCILCGKCVRVCNELREIGAINFANRGHETKISTAYDLPLIDSNCQFCGSCLDICPTGTITSKNTKWFDKEGKVTESSCVLCGIGCTFNYYSHEDMFVESIPSRDTYSNNKFPCVIGRFCIVPFNNGEDRLEFPLINHNNELIPSSWDEAYQVIIDNLKKYKPEEIGILASSDLSNESAYILNKLSRDILKTDNITLIDLLNKKEDSHWRKANIQGVFSTINSNEEKHNNKIIKNISEGKIKALYLTERLNNPDLLKGVEFLIIQDIYSSNCFEYANVVLPTCTFIEDSGTFIDSEQRTTNFTQVISNLGESKPDWKIFCELAKRFDNSFEKEFNFSNSEAIFEEIKKKLSVMNLKGLDLLLKKATLLNPSFEEKINDYITQPKHLGLLKYRGEKISNQVEDLKQLIDYRVSNFSEFKVGRKELKISRFKVISNKEIAINFFQLIIETPLIAGKVKPGNFVILMKEETSERIPLTISDWDVDKGTITLYFQEAGYSTMELTELTAEDYIYSVVGPLGVDVEIKNFGTVLLAGGCYGNGAIYPIVKALKTAGNKIITILEARNENLFYLEEEFEELSDIIIICTSDGSKGLKGKILTGLEYINNQDISIDRAYFIGCTYMMRDASNYTKKNGNIPTFVSLNTIMIDGTGMCGCCRLTLIQDGKEITKFACIDGPIFDGHQVKWDELLSRNERFEEPEVSIYQTHACKAIEKFNAGD